MKSRALSIGAITKPSPADRPVLAVDDLTVRFDTRDGIVNAVNRVSFSVSPEETIGIVGESGCGKSVTALSIMRLIPQPPGRIEKGTITLEDRNLLELTEGEMRRVRGNEISMIFQEPMTSLNPVLTVGFQIAEALMLHQGFSKRVAHKKAVESLELVRIPEAERRAGEYPHQMSGGMRQRAMIAMALSCDPKVLIADEPTTALDVTIQAQILRLMRQLKDRLRSAIIIITHDLGVIAETAERVVVMYAGRKVEEASAHELFDHPMHPYTHGLMASIPRIDKEAGGGEETRRRLDEIPGIVPSLREKIMGCPFAPRCRFVTDQCRHVDPPLVEETVGHWVACWGTERVRSIFHG